MVAFPGPRGGIGARPRPMQIKTTYLNINKIGASAMLPAPRKHLEKFQLENRLYVISQNSQNHHRIFSRRVSWKKGDGKNCWGKCGRKGGLCEKFCGDKGFCCRTGFKDCPISAAKEAGKSYHACVYQIYKNQTKCISDPFIQSMTLSKRSTGIK